MSSALSFAERLTPGHIVRAAAGRLPPWGYMKGALLIGALVLAVVGFVALTWIAVSGWRDNRTIAGLAAGRDLPVSVRGRPELKFARAQFLIERDRLEEAQALVSEVEAAGDPRVLASLHYNLANARLRAAFALLEQNRIDPAIPLVRLAKDGYRAALVVDPENWDARHNLDVAMRLVRDFPQIEQSSEDTPPETPKQLWTDLPRLPRGLP